jgi:acetyl-CoA synthetase
MTSIESLIHEKRLQHPPEALKRDAHIQDYESVYLHSITFPDRFWGNIASELQWEKTWDKVLDFQPPHHEWFTGGKTNITINALDRHARGEHRNKVALIWTNENDEEEVITYDRLLRRVCQLANGLKSLGVKKGDRVVIYMPLTPEAICAMLACARVGAIHAVIDIKLGLRDLRERIEDCQPTVVICADYIKKLIVDRRQDPKIELDPEREVEFIEFIDTQKQWCEAEIMEAEDPLFILYTSGSYDDRPKGIVHVHGGYMVGVYYLARAFYDIKASDIFWCMSDLSRIVGHSFVVYGPLLNGATVLAREGAIDYPDPGVVWRTVERHGVNILFTTPPAIRKFMEYGDGYIQSEDVSTLRLIASAGELLEPEVHLWAHEHILKGKGFVIDNWWQKELASPVIGTLPIVDAKLGKVGRPLPGVVADVVSLDEGTTVSPNSAGLLILRRPLPYMMRTIWNDDASYRAYWEKYPNCFTCGDLAFYDEEGYFAVLGHVEDFDKVTFGQR